MRLYKVTSIPQVDGGVRHLLMSDKRAAAEWRAEIAADPAMIDGGRPDYAIDAVPGQPLAAAIYPGSAVNPEAWRAIRAAIA